jgi:hypothetical protein
MKLLRANILSMIFSKILSTVILILVNKHKHTQKYCIIYLLGLCEQRFALLNIVGFLWVFRFPPTANVARVRLVLRLAAHLPDPSTVALLDPRSPARGALTFTQAPVNKNES